MLCAEQLHKKCISFSTKAYINPHKSVFHRLLDLVYTVYIFFQKQAVLLVPYFPHQVGFV